MSLVKCRAVRKAANDAGPWNGIVTVAVENAKNTLTATACHSVVDRVIQPDWAVMAAFSKTTPIVLPTAVQSTMRLVKH